nr:unnamed protein product [Digitaria exilis]
MIVDVKDLPINPVGPADQQTAQPASFSLLSPSLSVFFFPVLQRDSNSGQSSSRAPRATSSRLGAHARAAATTLFNAPSCSPPAPELPCSPCATPPTTSCKPSARRLRHCRRFATLEPRRTNPAPPQASPSRSVSTALVPIVVPSPESHRHKEPEPAPPHCKIRPPPSFSIAASSPLKRRRAERLERCPPWEES